MTQPCQTAKRSNVDLKGVVEMSIQIGSTGQLAKVTAVSEDGGRVHFDLRSGFSGWLDQVDLKYEIGDVLLLVNEDGRQRAEKLPSSAWPDQLWVGVVRIKSEDITVITAGGQNRKVLTKTDVEYDVGNTVEAGDVQGVVRVLSNTPISLFDLPSLDDSSYSRNSFGILPEGTESRI